MPALRGYRPIQRLATEETSIEAEDEPRRQTRRSDLVWVLAKGPERRLLLLEHQARVDPDMGNRMAQYMVNIWRSAAMGGGTNCRQDWPIYPLVFSTAARPFGTWLQYWPHAAGDGSVFFTAGPLIDIHAYPFPTRDAATFSLPRDNLVTSVIALARLQWALHRNRAAGTSAGACYNMIMHVMVDWLKPNLPAEGSRLGDCFAVWIAIGMADFLRRWPASREAVDNMSTLTFAALDRTMITVQDLVREGRLEGRLEGQREGQLKTLADYVQLEWGTAAASAFRARLADTDAELPTLADLQERRQRREPPLPTDIRDNHRSAAKPPGNG